MQFNQYKHAMKYNKLIIYYFSGTGNSKSASKWMLDEAERLGLNTQIINIDNFKKVEKPRVVGKTLIGFCAPTHGFNMPPIMLKYINKFPLVKNADVFLLNTRAGMKLHKLFLPGLSGIAQLFPALLLRLKGYKIVGMQPMDLPSNWLFVHPGLKKKVVDSIFVRCKKISEKFISNVLKGKKRYKALLSLPLDLAVAPISIAYYFIGRFFLAKTLIASPKCTRCEKCLKQCPVGAIKMINKRPYWTYKCESCMRCANICPCRAIETTHTISISLFVIASLVLSPLLLLAFKEIGVYEFLHQNQWTKSISSLIDMLVTLTFFILSYGILHYFMRFKFFAQIITYTSFSKYKFWRRYKAPKTKAP